MKEYFRETYQRETNVVPNGVEIPQIVEAKIISERWQLKKESYVLFLGRLVPEKGIHYLIEAYSRLQTDKKLVIAGGSSHSDDYVERLAAMTIDNDNIIMTGFVSGKTLEELYSNAYLYVLPSDVEGLPISLLEAMSYRRCCLVSDIKENITTCMDTGFSFKRGNKADLYEVLKKILDLPIETVHEMGEAGCQRVMSLYRWENVVEKTVQVYKKVQKIGKTEKQQEIISKRKEELFNKFGVELPFDICTILGVNILVADMERMVDFVEKNIRKLKGEYVCVSNGHTTVTAFEDEEYRRIQNGAVLNFPDGEPLSIVSRRRGFKEAQRVTGPDFMEQMFLKGHEGDGLRHFFYGGSQDTLDTLKTVLEEKYHGIQIAGMYSPPYRPLTEEEDKEAVKIINESNPDIIWVGLGAPKQEKWMADHKGKVSGLMFGVGAGFDYHAGKLKRAPKWMQKISMEWFMRLLQDPKRLWKRYLVTNIKFIWYILNGN